MSRAWILAAILGGAACTVQEHVVMEVPVDEDDEPTTDDVPPEEDEGEGDEVPDPDQDTEGMEGSGATTEDPPPCDGDPCGTTEDPGESESEGTSTGESTESGGEGTESAEGTA